MDKSISIDLGDPRTSKIAEALSNKTCVKILDLLAIQELTASDIASKLGIPLNTTGYNLEKLIAAGLVEKSSNFFWSVKGKKTPVYKVANKRIIISPKRLMNKIVPVLLFIGAAMLLSVILMFNNSQNTQSNLSNELKTFSSYEELQSYIEESNGESQGYGGTGSSSLEASGSSDSGIPSGPTATTTKSESFASDYSQTNIQVEGVDEIDIVKNDGKYIYLVSYNKVIIIEAYPADAMNIVSELEFDNYINGIFVEGDRLIVVESSYGYSLYGGAELDASTEKAASIQAPDGNGNAEIRIHIYDISEDKISKPELLETFALDGNYYAARLIDGNVYIIGTKYIDSRGPVIPYFRVGENVESVSADKIYYPGYTQSNIVFTSIMAIDLDSLDYKGDVFLTGYNSVIYVSDNAIYLTSQKTYDYQKVNEESLQVIVDALPGEYNSRAQKVIDSKDEYYIKYDKINQIMQEYFNRLSSEEKKEFDKKLTEANEKHYRDVSKRLEKTIIHKIGIDGLDLTYLGEGEVPGYLLNQFSMDENDGYFRIATTTGNNAGIGSSLNNLYMLDEDLEVVGMIEDIAHGERIYSARFVGDKAYIVTFRQVDPLYVIDLENPRDPEILGYLKVTGFSNYLQPIGDDLLLGIGHEATEEGRAEGLKISLFDVSDFENPIELDKYVVESDWSYSEAEYEHKAVLFDDKRDLLVIPVSYSQQLGQNWENWQGAFVFTVTDKDVSLKGKISHDINNDKLEQYYNSQAYVQRSLFMEDTLYTVSNMFVKANLISDLKAISSVELPNEEPIYYAYDVSGVSEVVSSDALEIANLRPDSFSARLKAKILGRNLI